MPMHPWLTKTPSEIWSVPKQDGDVGIEIELEGENLPQTIDGWAIHQENSLRGRDGRHFGQIVGVDDTPREYVTNGAVKRGDIRATLETLQTRLAAPDIIIRRTTRTSTHIHVNVQPMPLHAVFNYVLLQTMVEPVLLHFCGPERDGNLFCIQTGETTGLHHLFASWAEAMKSGVTAWPKVGKYACINTDPVMRFGSVETRCFPASTSAAQITGWVQWLLALRDKAKYASDSTGATFLKEAYARPLELYAEIFGEGHQPRFIANSKIFDMIRFGVENAYEAHLALLPMFDWKEPEKKKKKAVRYEDMVNEFAGTIPTRPFPGGNHDWED